MGENTSVREHHKLVRDRIPEIIDRNGEVAEHRRLNSIEFKFALLLKLIEESEELAKAESYFEQLNEAADCKEVCDYIAAEFHIGLAALQLRPFFEVSDDPRKDLVRLANMLNEVRHDHTAMAQCFANYRKAFELAQDAFMLGHMLYECQSRLAAKRGRFRERIWLERTYSKNSPAQAAS